MSEVVRIAVWRQAHKSGEAISCWDDCIAKAKRRKSVCVCEESGFLRTGQQSWTKAIRTSHGPARRSDYALGGCAGGEKLEVYFCVTLQPLGVKVEWEGSGRTTIHDLQSDLPKPSLQRIPQILRPPAPPSGDLTDQDVTHARAIIHPITPEPSVSQLPQHSVDCDPVCCIHMPPRDLSRHPGCRSATHALTITGQTAIFGGKPFGTTVGRFTGCHAYTVSPLTTPTVCIKYSSYWICLAL